MRHRRRPEPVPIERATPNDLVMLAMDRNRGTPEQLGAVLVLDPPPGTELAAPEQALAITVVADPDHTPDLPALAAALQGELAWTASTGPHRSGHSAVNRRQAGCGAARTA
jgi:hypothetical protein